MKARATALRLVSVLRPALLALALLAPSAALAVTCTAVANGAWNVAATWERVPAGGLAGCDGANGAVAGTPGSADNVIIPSPRNVTSLGAARQALSLTVDVGGTLTTGSFALTIAAGTGVLTVNGNVAGNGNAASRIIKLSTGAMSGGGTFTNLNDVTITGDTTISGSLRFTGAKCQLILSANADVILNAGATLTFDPAATCATSRVITMGNPSTFTNNGTLTAGNITTIANNGTFTNNNTLTAAAVTIGNPGTFTNVGTVLVPATASVTSVTGSNAAGSVWNNNANSTLTLTGAGTPFGVGTLNAATNPNTVDYAGAAQVVKVPSTNQYWNFSLSGSSNKDPPTAATFTVLGNMSLSGTATWRGDNPATDPVMDIRGNLSIGGTSTYITGTGSNSLRGNFTNDSVFTATATNTFNMTGTAAQTLGGTAALTTFYNLTINNTAALATRTVTLGQDISTTNQLTFSNGRIVTTGAYEVVLPSTALAPSGISGSPNYRYVAGRLQRFVAGGAGPTSVTFDVGTNGAAAPSLAYTPATFVFTGVAVGGGSFIVEANYLDHTNIATSGLNSASSVNRWWNATTTNVVGLPVLPAFTSYSATFNFIAGVSPGDLDPSAVGNEGTFNVRRRVTATGVWNPTSTGTLNASSSQITNVTALGEFAIGNRLLDHYAITGSATALTCEANAITFTGHTSAHVATPPPAGVVLAITTGTAAGLWEPTLVAGTGTWAPSGLSNGQATYTWPGGENLFTVRLRQSTPATLNVNVVDNFLQVESEDLSVAYSNAAFRFVDGSDNALPNQVAGTTSGSLRLQAVPTTCTTPGACTGACTTASVGDFRSGAATSVDLAFECVNPTSCVAVPLQTLAFVNNGSTNIAGNPAGLVSTYTAKSLTWGANGVASFTMNYTDVGQLSLWARWPAGGPAQMSGTSAPFVVRPFGFTLSNIKRTSDSFANPAAADATGTAFIKAGQAFTLTVTAINASASATPNYGKETTPEGVLLTPALVAGLGQTANPALGNNTIAGSEFGAGGAVADANGVATVTNVSWDEVGIITITPSVGDASYLGAGDTTGTASVNVGRFYPDHFAITGSPTLTNRAVLSPCVSTFSYMGEGMDLVFSLRAENSSNGVTQNYRTSGAAAQNFAKLSAASTSAYGFGARSGATNLTGRISSIYPGSAPSFVGGVLALNAANPVRLAIGRKNTGGAPQDTPDGPYTATSIGIAPIDSDGVAMGTLNLDVDGVGGFDHANLSLAPAPDVRFGRLRLSNAVGSEKLALKVPMQTEYWSGATFATNSLDSCTTFARSAIVLDTYSSGLNPGAGNCKTFVQQSPITFASGVGTLTLAAPTGGATGSLRLTPNMGTVVAGRYCDNATSGDDAASAANMTYLFGRWDDAATSESPSDPNTAYDDNPRARASFGVYGSQPRNFIFFRENY
jgi:MSHA biogenesis protein MshQ